MTIEDLEAEILKLTPYARAQLAAKLLQSLEALSDAENDRIWADEALRRHEELEAGTVASRPAAEVFREARDRFS